MCRGGVSWVQLSVVAGALGACPDAVSLTCRGWCTGSPVGLLSGAVPGAGLCWAGHVRGVGQRGRAVGAAPLLRCLVRCRETPPGGRGSGAVPASAAGADAAALVPRHVHTRGQAAADPGRPRPAAAVGAAGPGPALPAEPG